MKSLFGQSKEKPKQTAAERDGLLQVKLHNLENENTRLKGEVENLEDQVVKLRLQLRALRTLQEASVTITARTNVVSLLERVLQSALLSINASDGSLMLVDEATGELVFAVVHGQVKNSLVGHRLPMGTGIAGWVAAQREAVVIPDVSRDPRFSNDVDRTFQFQTRSMVCVPILANERVLGVFQAINKFEDRPFDDSDMAIMNVVAQLAANVILKAEAVARAQDKEQKEA
ncbi:MAG: GAF domain-containing protein [Anaerolineales bacterium]|nr:GAF domain-containing protein [Anaerolineales bacterium]